VVTFTNSAFALNHILKWGGSAYLPYRIAKRQLDAGQLFEVKDAPRFRRGVYLVRNTLRTQNWTWFDDVCAQFKRTAEDIQLQTPP